jgi:hypothetical protein
MRYKAGDTVNFNGLVGKIESASINNKIGFSEEKRREPIYTIRFENIPESKLFVQDGTDREDTSKSPQAKRKPTTRKSKLHSITNKGTDK